MCYLLFGLVVCLICCGLAGVVCLLRVLGFGGLIFAFGFVVILRALGFGVDYSGSLRTYCLIVVGLYC